MKDYNFIKAGHIRYALGYVSGILVYFQLTCGTIFTPKLKGVHANRIEYAWNTTRRLQCIEHNAYN